MVRIENTIIKKQANFWNHCLFHPTDAVEDPWGKRILDKMAQDKSIGTIRIYTMFEDIVYLDGEDNIAYDFRVSDLRLDYLVEKGYDLLLTYAAVPDCISDKVNEKTSVSKNKTRYKGKMFNTNPPSDYALWEEVCYQYTKHIVERYGMERIKRWQMQCFNEPDQRDFFLSRLPNSPEATMERCREYCKLYSAFEHGIRRVSDCITIGGPALAWENDFLGSFLDYVKENGLKLDFITVHNYGTSLNRLNDKSRKISVSNNIRKHRKYLKTIKEHGFENTDIIVDEWGGAYTGFFNRDECPDFMFRETEVFSAYFAKLIHELVYNDFKVEKMMICLSGQHEMTTDFSGFRNFFTLNFIAKPIYNAYVLASKLGENLLASEKSSDDIFLIPTKKEDGRYAVLISYSSENFEEDIPERLEKIEFSENISGKTLTVYCIDKEHTNPYRLAQRKGITEYTAEELKELRKEGTLIPMLVQDVSEELTLKLTANCTYLVMVE